MGKNVLKYGGKSGILPVPRPIFKGPIREPTAYEKSHQASIVQGYAEGVPVPIINGKPLPRHPKPPTVLTVEQRIKLNIERMEPKPTTSHDDLNEYELWRKNRAAIRREFLREAYIKEGERLAKIDKWSEEKRNREQQAKAQAEQETKTEHIELSIPTIEKLLESKGLTRGRTSEEKAIVQEKRVMNRRIHELELLENKAEQVLDLYHAAADFITTQEELDDAIYKAFEVNVANFDADSSNIQNRLFGHGTEGQLMMEHSTGVILDTALGEVRGRPGLSQVRELLSGEREQLKRKAQVESTMRDE